MPHRQAKRSGINGEYVDQSNDDDGDVQDGDTSRTD